MQLARLVPATVVLILALSATHAFIPSSSSKAAVGPLITCDFAPGGDGLENGFYVPAYPGSTITRVDLSFSARAAGNFTFRLTARAGAFDGAVIATDDASVQLSDVDTANVVTTFEFTSAAVTPGTTVAFIAEKLSGPNTSVYYSVGGYPFASQQQSTNCPVKQTEDLSPPLSEVRRDGIGIIIYGEQSSAPTVTPTPTLTPTATTPATPASTATLVPPPTATKPAPTAPATGTGQADEGGDRDWLVALGVLVVALAISRAVLGRHRG